MEGFSYSDIFATKGIEYLVVITFLVLLIPFWRILNKPIELVRKFRMPLGKLTFKELEIPQGLYYGPNHTWLHLEKSGVAKVGLDDLLLHLTGRVSCSLLKQSGEKITKGETIAFIYQEDKKLQILSPVTGILAQTNSTQFQNPTWINEDPYGNGWLYKIKPDNWILDSQKCYFANDAIVWAGKELSKIKDFLAESQKKYSHESSLVILQDGGELSDYTLASLSKQIWNDFETKFMMFPKP